jgi:GNAT superfamily N-acetyltransferase
MTYRIRPATLDDVEVLVHHRFAMFRDMGVPLDAAPLAPAFAQWLRKMMPLGTYRAWLVESTIAPAEPPRLESRRRASSQTSPRVGGDADTLANGGTVVAGGGATIVPWPPGPRYPGDSLAFVYNVYTEPAHRRRGLARRIMSTIHDWCRENGITSLALNASEDGRPLYESLGYVAAPRPMMFCSLGAERGAPVPDA